MGRNWKKLTEYKANLSGEKSRINIIKSLTQYPSYQKFIEETKNEKQSNLNYHQRAEYLHNMLNNHSPLLKESDINIIPAHKQKSLKGTTTNVIPFYL